jgi:hypothetical protein
VFDQFEDLVLTRASCGHPSGAIHESVMPCGEAANTVEAMVTCAAISDARRA